MLSSFINAVLMVLNHIIGLFDTMATIWGSGYDVIDAMITGLGAVLNLIGIILAHLP